MDDVTILNLLKNYWSFFVAVASGIYAFAHLKFQNKDQEVRLICLEEEFKKLDSQQNQINIRLAEIQKDISWIREKLTSK